MAIKNINITGRILSNQTKAGIPNLKVEAWDKDSLIDDLVGSSMTDSNGAFSIVFTRKYFKELFMDRKPDLYFKVYSGLNLISSTENNVLWNIDSDQANIEILIDMETTNKNTQFIVRGKVTNKNNKPLRGLLVKAFNIDMRSETLLGEGLTDKTGMYKITYTGYQPGFSEKYTADLCMRVYHGGEILFNTGIDEVIFNASVNETVNIVITIAITPKNNEFDAILGEISGLIGSVRVEELQEDKSHRDITFLSGETNISRESIEYLVVAHRLATFSKIDAAFFYALLRENTLLKRDLGKVLQARMSIGMTTEIKPLIYDAALTAPGVLKEDAETAIKDMIVPKNIGGKNLIKSIEALSRYKQEAESYYKNDYPKKFVDVISRFVTENKIGEMATLYQENKSDLGAFFSKITDPSFFSSEAKATDAKTKIVLGEILGFDNEIISQISKSFGIKKPEDVKKLASLNKTGWVNELTKASEKIKISGKKLDKKLISLHASSLVRKMEKEFPTVAFSAQLGRESKPVFQQQEKLKSFFGKHEEFDLRGSNVDLFFKEKGMANAENDAMRNELKSVQRVFKLVPHYGKTNALLSNQIHSSQSIVSAGETRFVKEIAPRAGIDKVEAKEIFQKAERRHTAALLIAGELQDTLSAMNIPALEMTTLSAKIEAVSKDFPNLKSLFQLTDVCACDHCRSVYSPAAYLVEILQFLSQRLVTDLTLIPPITTNLAKDVLFTRRPDLGEIDLGCENATTPLPYIDLVCELLEEAIAPEAGVAFTGAINPGVISVALLAALPAEWFVTDKAIIYETEIASGGSAASLPHYLRDTKAVCKITNKGGSNWNVKRLRQTLSPAEELAAAPDYVNQDAYNILKSLSNAFAFKLPFDLSHAEATAYFDRFGFSRADLMRNFIVGGVPADKAIAAEILGLTETERILIITPDPANQNIYWNTTTADAVSEMKIVDTFLTKSGLTYTELDLLLELKFIDPDNNLFIKHQDLSCDTEKKEIANLDANALDRIHRFLRFQKKTKWKFETIDDIIIQAKLGQGNLNDTCLIKAASLVRLAAETSIKLEDLLGFYGEISYTEFLNPGKKPLYHQIFINKAKNGFIDENLLPEKVDGPVIHPAVILLLADVKTSLQVCLRIKEKELDLLLPLLPDDKLSFSNLSTLFCQTVLIRKLKLKTEDFLILKDLIGLDIQLSPESTLEFAESVAKARKSALKASQMEFQLSHPTVYETSEISDDKITTILKTLQAAYQKSFDSTVSPFDSNSTADSQKEKVQALLSGLNLLNEGDVKILINFIDAIWEYTWTDSEYVLHSGTVVADAITFLTDKLLDTLIDTTQIIIAINAIPAEKAASVLADSNEATALAALNAANEALAADPANAALLAAQAAAVSAEVITLAAATVAASGYELARNALVKAYLDSVSVFLFKSEKQDTLIQTITSSFKVTTDRTTVVLEHAILKQPAAGTTLIQEYLLSDTLIDTDMTTMPVTLPTIDSITFPNQYFSLRLLHKLFPLLASFNLEDEQVKFLLSNASDLGWFECDAIPYQAGQTSVSFDAYILLLEMLDYAKQFTPVENPSDPENPISFWGLMEMLLPGSTSTTTEWLDALALLTGYDLDDLVEIDTYFGFSAVNLDAYRSSETWKMIIDSAEYLRIIGLPLSDVSSFITPTLLPGVASQLRVALKVRYDDSIWLETLKEIMNVVRAKKRNALVAYLLSANPEMKDENYLYDYFLVDVEMESCMPSSRIVLAHGSVQLFVTRCLMGLEPKAAADLDNDASWTQWKWMKNYRVWEANRKVFLYPENWIEAELRDDKSFLFSELENELLQNELNEFTAEDALIRYLEKLDNIAFLEVVATWYQVDIRTMHVFARTKGGDPAIYYYRTFEKEFYWTPWQKVELDISGYQLLAFMRNNRLCLAWPVFSEEPDPDPEATLPDQSDATPQSVDKPKRKLKMQIAISEFANQIWQPKKVSIDAIFTPTGDYVTYALPRDIYNLMYNEIADQIILFTTTIDTGSEYNGNYYPDYEGHSIKGIFNVTGCKGYPELVTTFNSYMPDFLPDFKQSLLKSQRYFELNYSPDDLAVRNGVTFILNHNYLELLKKTPGFFRLTYPHQLTIIDVFSFFAQYLIMYINGFQDNGIAGHRKDIALKIPLGTLLPYFIEDSKYAYVIVPGFYRKEVDENSEQPLLVQRTGSNIIQLLEDIVALINKLLVYLAAPSTELLTSLITDYQAIIAELTILSQLKYGEKFSNMYHPLLCALRTILYKDGVPELMKRETQLQTTTFDFKTNYEPTPRVPEAFSIDEGGIKKFVHPIEDLDFSSDGSYSGYNWELFFHVPFMLATRLTQDQKFEEALTWFHYMFNPTGALSGDAPEKYWVTKPFFQTHKADYSYQIIDNLLKRVADPGTPEIADLEKAIDEWRSDPFKPHVVARFRTVSYQKALLMKYIDNLTEWGDYLFRQDTMESIVQATQMYILADKLLGPKPRIIPPLVKPPYETYNQLEAKLDAFGNTLIELENILPDPTVLPEEGAELPSPMVTLSMLYFCIPPNEKMVEYWDRVADRLFKIRHCQNIDGVERSLALFAPPIDPGMLVKAAAAGLDISSVIAGMNAPLPFYRFQVLSQKANELVQEVRNLGNSLLQALEKKDGEAMALLRSELEIKILNAVTDMKQLQIKEAKEQIEILKKTKDVTTERYNYYEDIEKIIPNEQLNLDKLAESHGFQIASQVVQTLAGVVALIPDIVGGASGFGGSPHVVVQWGGLNLLGAAKSASDVLNIFATAASYEASRASILGGYDRRFEDWKLQERLASLELKSIDKQIVAAEIRQEIAETDLRNHKLQIENAKKSDEFMRTKFTNKQLYEWMIKQISSVYFQSYKLAHDFAKKAERCYQHELGNGDTFIQYGYWDSLKKGLQSADHLIHDLKRMETSYLNKNKREYELTKHVSLCMLDPLALVKLRATGSCDFDIPEALFDMDHAGHYFRRLKSVSLSIPCIAGPYTSISAKLSLVSNRYRKNTNPDNAAATGYLEDPGNDERFTYNIGFIQSIAASNAQNDSGMFELNFRDERYLPYEGTGAIGTWRLELPADVRQFDYSTISDVLLHLKYTAREGGSSLKTLASDALLTSLDEVKQQLSQTGLHHAINMKHDMPNDWFKFIKNGLINLTIDKSRLPYFVQALPDLAIESVTFIANVKENPSTFTITIDGTNTILNKLVSLGDLCLKTVTGSIDPGNPFDLGADVTDLSNLSELMLVVKYTLTV